MAIYNKIQAPLETSLKSLVKGLHAIVGLGFDPIWCGVLMVRMLEIGLITQLIGIVCFIMSGVTKVPISTIHIPRYNPFRCG